MNLRLTSMTNVEQIPGLPWTTEGYRRKWASKSAQSVNSAEYKQLRQYIHMPYRKIDNQGVKCYYFPTYVIFKVKNITDFDFESLAASINGVLIISIMVDYRDNFSINESDKDQKQIREKLEKIFDFKYLDPKNHKKKDENAAENNQDDQNDKNNEGNKPQPQKNFLFVQFNRDNPLRLPTKRIFQGQINQSEEKNDQKLVTQIKWTIRKEFRISLAAGSVISDLIAPFNLLNFHLSLTFEDIDVQIPIKKNLNENQENSPDKKMSGKSQNSNSQKDKQQKELVKFKFNCMKRVGNDSSEEKKRMFEQLNFTDDGSLGEYDLAETSLSVTCQKFQSQEMEEDNMDPYRSYKVITFKIPFYKYPIMDSLTIFIPLVLITILTLFTFAQGPDYNDKIGNIATLMIVYVGLVPVINDSLPPTTSITLIDLVVYAQLGVNILCLIRGYYIMNYNNQQFDAYALWNDPMFIISVVIACLSGIVLLALLIYYCVMKGCYYNLQEADVDESQRKTIHWVSPHMYNDARNIKTEIKTVEEERKKNKKADDNNNNPSK